MSEADRARRLRDRRRRQCTVAPVEVDFDMIEELLDAGMIGAADSENRVALGRAIGRALHQWKINRHA